MGSRSTRQATTHVAARTALGDVTRRRTRLDVRVESTTPEDANSTVFKIMLPPTD
jgi:hypothetical protein